MIENTLKHWTEQFMSVNLAPYAKNEERVKPTSMQRFLDNADGPLHINSVKNAICTRYKDSLMFRN